MTAETDPDPPVRPSGSARPGVLVGAVVALAVIVLAGIAIALTRGDDSDSDHQPAFGPVTVQGDVLSTLEDGRDPAAGAMAPLVHGETPAGAPITIGAPGEPTIIVFLAHWCPHCRAELPILVDIASDGGFEGVRTVAVLTQTDPNAPNFPPVEWIDDEGWTGEILLDDEAFTTAETFGVSAYPFLVALDATGTVVARESGELPADEVAELVESARGG